MSKLEVIGLQKQKIMLGSTPVSQEQKSEADVGNRLTITGQLKSGKT